MAMKMHYLILLFKSIFNKTEHAVHSYDAGEGWIFYKILQNMLGNAEQYWQYCWTRYMVILYKSKDLMELAMDKQTNRQTKA